MQGYNEFHESTKHAHSGFSKCMLHLRPNKPPQHCERVSANGLSRTLSRRTNSQLMAGSITQSSHQGC